MYTIGQLRISILGGNQLWPIIGPNGGRIATVTGERSEAEDLVVRLNSAVLTVESKELKHELSFKLPVRLEGHSHGNLCLVAADAELICVLQAATAEEAEAIVSLVNQHGVKS
jgi:hypothetical protein